MSQQKKILEVQDNEPLQGEKKITATNPDELLA